MQNNDWPGARVALGGLNQGGRLGGRGAYYRCATRAGARAASFHPTRARAKSWGKSAKKMQKCTVNKKP